MSKHHVIAGVGVAVGIVLGFVFYNWASPTITQFTSKIAA